MNIKDILRNDNELITALGGASVKHKRVYDILSPNAEELPCVIITELSLEDDNFFDNEPQAVLRTVRVTLYAKDKSKLNIIKIIKKIIKNNCEECTITIDADEYDSETGVFAKRLEASIIETEE